MSIVSAAGKIGSTAFGLSPLVALAARRGRTCAGVCLGQPASTGPGPTRPTALRVAESQITAKHLPPARSRPGGRLRVPG